MKRGWWLLALVPLMGCIEYRVHLDLDSEGVGRFVLSIQEDDLAPNALGRMVSMMTSPFVKIDRGEQHRVGLRNELRLEGELTSIQSVGDSMAFGGVRCYYGPVPAARPDPRVLFQLERDPILYRGSEGKLVFSIRFPCAVERTNGQVLEDGRVEWQIPLGDVRDRELRIWALLAAESG